MTSPSVESAVAELRASLMVDMETARRLHDAQDADGRRAVTAVLTFAFTKAAETRFGQHPSPEDVIEFVADARARVVGPDSVSAEDGEKAIRGVLNEEHLLTGMQPRAIGAAQMSMLFAITHENEQAPKQIDGLLAWAADAAETYFRQRAAQ